MTLGTFWAKRALMQERALKFRVPPKTRKTLGEFAACLHVQTRPQSVLDDGDGLAEPFDQVLVIDPFHVIQEPDKVLLLIWLWHLQLKLKNCF